MTGQAAATGAGAAARAGGLFSGLTNLVSLFGFAEGTDHIMRGSLAVVHAGEEIRPARGSGPWTGRGGDMQVHFSPRIDPVDARGVQAMLNDYAPQFARTVANHWNVNPTSRPKF